MTAKKSAIRTAPNTSLAILNTGFCSFFVLEVRESIPLKSFLRSSCSESSVRVVTSPREGVTIALSSETRSGVLRSFSRLLMNWTREFSADAELEVLGASERFTVAFVRRFAARENRDNDCWERPLHRREAAKPRSARNMHSDSIPATNRRGTAEPSRYSYFNLLKLGKLYREKRHYVRT